MSAGAHHKGTGVRRSVFADSPALHWQRPFTQVSAPGQVEHWVPLVPQLAGVGARHTFDRQQPFGHDARPHGAAAPHAPLEHASPGAHAWHRAPAGPHAKASLPARHDPSASMQPEQLIEVHRPKSQRSKGEHCWHTPPSRPHASGRLPGWQSS